MSVVEEFLFVGGPWAGEVRFARPDYPGGVWQIREHTLISFSAAEVNPTNTEIKTHTYYHRQFWFMDHFVHLLVHNSDDKSSHALLDAMIKPEARHLFKMFGD